MDHALAFLKTENTGVLSTLSPDHEIHGAAIHFVVDNDYTFYFATKQGTKKFENLLKNPRVALTIVKTGSLETVQVEGVTSLVVDENKASGVMAELVRTHGAKSAPWTAPAAKVKAGDWVVIQIVPTWLRYADFGALKDGESESPFEQIIPKE